MKADAQTIVATSTPAGVSALGVVRISGPDVLKVAASLFRLDLDDVPHEFPIRQMILRSAYHDHSLVDQLMVARFEAPASYTGEEMLELFPHGNPLIIRQLLDAILHIPGTRVAEPGEFTRRAFENGKIDLVQAEAVGALLHATAEEGIRNAQKLLQGRFSSQIHTIADQVKHFAALLELEVDFVEDETEADQSEWLPKLRDLQRELEYLLSRFKNPESMNRIPRVVFFGAPNAGKSSLINALLREDRILVSAVPGTTRDTVQVRLILPGGEVELVDTAGLSETPVDELDAISQQRALKILSEADLLIEVVDGSRENPETFMASLPQNIPCWRVCSKSDLPCLPNHQEKHFEFVKEISVSAHRGDGLEDLYGLLNQQLFSLESQNSEFWITSFRQKQDVEIALQFLQNAINLLEQGQQSPEILAFEFQGVRNALGRIIGETTAEDVLQTLFSGFCIGK